MLGIDAVVRAFGGWVPLPNLFIFL